LCLPPLLSHHKEPININQQSGYNSSMDKPNYSIVITGEWPGAGQSTTASLLAKKLRFTRVYAGFLFRKFAHVWKIEQKRLNWNDFEQAFDHNDISLDDYEFFETDFNEQTLHEWQHQLRSVNTPDVWDKIIDRQSLKALEKPGVIVEAKVGVLLDKTNLLPAQAFSHHIYKILLTCPPEISSHRVIKRKIENGELPTMNQDNEAYSELVRQTTTDTINRHLRDWERYEKIYGIYRSDVYKPGIIKIDTSNKTEAQVVDAIIDHIQNHPVNQLTS
jgi:cytidylate kinase